MKHERPLYVHGLGHFHPENVIDNQFLEELDIGTNDEWILQRVGIASRRTVLPLDYIRQTHNTKLAEATEAALYSNVDTGKRAAMHALERAGLAPSDIGMVVAGGCSAEMCIPSEACRIAAALEVEAPALDINSACASFGAQLHLLATMGGLPPYVLVVNPENTTRSVDYSDRSTAVLWGDGTSAAIVSTQEPARLRVVESTLTSQPSRWSAVTIPRFEHFIQQGSAVQRFAIKTASALADELLPSARAYSKEYGGTARFVGHQANSLMLKTVAQRADIAPDHHWHNVREYGNTGAAGAPTVLSQHWDELSEGDSVVLAVVGAGLTWSSLRMEIGSI
jgi:3-oxoacyl-[acyl-carrier-protein] synthase-3